MINGKSASDLFVLIIFPLIFSFKPFLRREKYKLFVCFYEALMVSETDGPVEFEVSIGKYYKQLIQDFTVITRVHMPSGPRWKIASWFRWISILERSEFCKGDRSGRDNPNHWLAKLARTKDFVVRLFTLIREKRSTFNLLFIKYKFGDNEFWKRKHL